MSKRERLENHGSPHPSSALVNSRAIWGSKESKRESGAVFLMECVLDEISENALCFGFQAGRFVPQAFSLLNKAVVNLPAWHHTECFVQALQTCKVSAFRRKKNERTEL